MSAPVSSAARVTSAAEAARDAASWRAHGQRLGLADGAFDLLDVGHARTLAALRAGLDRLVVAVWDDAAAAARLGRGRPVQSAAERARLVAALRGVDRVAIVDEAALAALVEAVRAERRDREPADRPATDRVGRLRGRGPR